MYNNSWMEIYIKSNNFKHVINLGVYDASDITGWFINNNNLFKSISLIDNYQFEDILLKEINPDDLIKIIYDKIYKKANINFIIKDGALIDYTTFNVDLVILDCDSASACEKIIIDRPDSVFCFVSFMNSFQRTDEAFTWINNGLIYPFLYLRNTFNLFFTANKEKHEYYYDKAKSINYGTPFIKYERIKGNKIVCPRDTEPYYNYQSIEL